MALGYHRLFAQTNVVCNGINSITFAAAIASWFERPIFATAEEQKTMEPLFCFIIGRARQRSKEKLELRFVEIV